MPIFEMLFEGYIGCQRVVQLFNKGNLNDRLLLGWMRQHKDQDPIKLIKGDFIVHRMAMVLAVLILILWPGTALLNTIISIPTWIGAPLVIVGILFFLAAFVVLMIELMSGVREMREEFPNQLTRFLNELADASKPEDIADETENQLLLRAKKTIAPLALRMLELNEQHADEDLNLAKEKLDISGKMKSLYDLLVEFDLGSPTGYQPYYDAAREQRQQKAAREPEPATPAA